MLYLIYTLYNINNMILYNYHVRSDSHKHLIKFTTKEEKSELIIILLHLRTNICLCYM